VCGMGKKEDESTNELYLMDLHNKFKEFGIKSVVASDKITLEFQNQEQIDSFLKRL